MVPNSGDYKVSAKCNNIIEAIEKSNKLFNIGIQWHPERTEDEPSKKIFKAFIESCKIYMNNKNL